MGYEKAGEEEIRRTIGLSLAKTLEALTGNCEDGQRFERFFKEKADEVMVAQTTLYEGVKEMLESLRNKGVKIAIVTTKYHYRIEAILEVNRMGHLIDEIIGGEDVKNPKPDPEGMKLLMERLKVSPEEILYVGDSLVDAETAKAAGVDFVAVLTGTTEAEEFAGYPCKEILSTAAQITI